ncbi:tautomerase family protein [Acidimangrovimonas sediminis]|uniref:tautomerase family protein n=1 Tax=Acidimangrovimonas sediminis TaxID=2056283 RepID=UPI000C7FD894|nr:tautomerase family protein [Acidimangrovimonas sediminis]
MPHVIVKALPKSEEQKKRLAEAITRSVTEIFDYERDQVSVAIEDVPQERWKEDVYLPEIAQADPSTLYKTPGYEL